MRFLRLGSMVVLLLLTSCSTQKARSHLLGYWESADDKKASVEFLDDGAVVFGGGATDLLDWKITKMLRDFNVKLGRKNMTFKVVDKEHVEILGEFVSLLEGLSAGAEPGSKPKVNVGEFRPRSTLAFTITGDELTLCAENSKSMKFRRSG